MRWSPGHAAQTRARIVAAIRARPEGSSYAELSAAIGLDEYTIREHLLIYRREHPGHIRRGQRQERGRVHVFFWEGRAERLPVTCPGCGIGWRTDEWWCGPRCRPCTLGPGGQATPGGLLAGRLADAIGMSMPDFAAFTGTSREAVKNWVRGHSRPTLERLLRIIPLCINSGSLIDARRTEWAAYVPRARQESA
jgi:hypothetical protein